VSPIVRGVIGTAGHVDHGKTSLVRALTGAPGDRLPEEKKRGITIDLGFAQWDAPGMSLGVIDVPGHERFVGTMVAGAAGIDAVIWVVAANDGVMPQSREHLEICGHLGITRGVIAITKIDAADADTIALVEEDVRETVRGTFLERAEIVRCSARESIGLAELTEAVRRALEGTRTIETEGPVWLPIDRAFVKHGHGTIVTGTLARGTIEADDTLELLGVSTKVGVRGLHVHGSEVPRAKAATRLAVQLRGIEVSDIARGMVLTTPGWQSTTTSIDVALGGERPRARRELVLHVGATHVTVHARAHGELVRLTSTVPFATYAGDRFVLRRPELARDRTIGGGEVVDPHPSLARPKKNGVREEAAARVLTMVRERAAGATKQELARRLPPSTRLAPLLSHLVRERAILEVSDASGTRWVAMHELDRAKTEVRTALVGFHRTHPAASGATVADLSGAVPAPWRPLVPIATAALVREGAIAGGDRVAAVGHDAHALADRVADVYRAAGLEALGEDAAREACGFPERTFRDVITELVRTEKIDRIATGVYVDRAALETLVARVRTYFESNETLSPGDFKTMTSLTRKNAIAMLEWLDRRGVTRRKGEGRVRA